MANIPDKPSLDGIEARWASQWEADGTYRFDRTATRERGVRDRHAAADRDRARSTSATCSATPTPTPSPATSACAASRSSTRSAGTTTASPTERRVQNYYGVRCDPIAAVRPRLRAAVPRRRRPRTTSAIPVSRPNFIELCDELVTHRRAGLRGHVPPPRAVVDWSLLYTTIDDVAAGAPASARSCATSPAARPTAQDAPTLWDVDYRTAVAQAEMEDRERPGAYHQLAFHRTDGDGRRRDRHDPARAARQRAWPSSPTPTTTATSRCSARRCARRCSASRSRSSPTSWPTPTRAPASP